MSCYVCVVAVIVVVVVVFFEPNTAICLLFLEKSVDKKECMVFV